MRKLGGVLIKLFVAFLLYVALLFPGIIFDMTYEGRLQYSLLVDAVDRLVNFARWIGLSYSAVNSFLANSLGMLITGISLTITVGIHIATRSENCIYGIPRIKWKSSLMEHVYRIITRAIFFGPPLLVLAMVRSLCVTGCLILVYSYLFLFFSYFYLNDRWNQEADRKMVAQRLLASVNLRNDNKELKEYLENIAIEAKEGTRRTDIRQLFEMLQTLIRRQEKTDTTSFLCSYFFFDIIYMQSEVQQHLGLDLLKNKVYFLDENEEVVSVWAMLSCVFKGDSKKLTNEFVDWCIGLKEPKIQSISVEERISYDAYIILMGLLLFQVEYMFRIGKYYLDSAPEKLQSICEYRKYIMDKKYIQLRKQLRSFNALLGKDYKKFMDEAFEVLESDEDIDKGKSMVFNMINLC